MSRLLLEEVERRKRAKTAAEGVSSNILAECFKEQRDFILDPAREKAALCSRRAGKTDMWPRYCTIAALNTPRSLIRIWAINRLTAKNLLWEKFRLLLARHRIQVTLHETELTITFENGSIIRFLGADKEKEAQKKRGEKTLMEVVLESQLYGSFLKTLVEDVAQPCLVDQQGTLCLEGTPGSTCTGFWFQVTGNNPHAKRWGQDGWSNHRWTLLDNPHIPGVQGEVARIKALRRWTDESPTYLREYLGRWVNDLGSLFYKFDPIRNTFTLGEVTPWGQGWEHTLGWDLGSRDDMALMVWGYHPDLPNLYEAFSWKKPGALAPEIMGQIETLEQRGFNFVKKVADTGGGGRMYVEEVMSRYNQVFEAAKKSEKYEHVRLMNDDYLGGFLKLQRGGLYAEEVSQLERDKDWPPEDKPDAKPREDPRFPNHISDAGLYSHRAAYHYLHREEPAKPRRGTEAYVLAQQERIEQSLIQKPEEWWEPNANEYPVD